VVRYAIPHWKTPLDCPNCGAALTDITESWHTFRESHGAEYLATYVTIWHCPSCHTVVGGQDEEPEWVIEPEEALVEE
jgi:hypothetical protein